VSIGNTGDLGDAGDSLRPVREKPERPLLADRIDPASDLSSGTRPALDPRGLSVFPRVIFEPSLPRERNESFVSDLLNEGIDEIGREVEDPLFLGVEAPEPGFDGWFPMVLDAGVPSLLTRRSEADRLDIALLKRLYLSSVNVKLWVFVIGYW
jgi:hypothetical protein